MLIFTRKVGGWEISEDRKIVFSKIKTLDEALAIVKAYSDILINFSDLNKKRAA